jgi:hypothetical protein
MYLTKVTPIREKLRRQAGANFVCVALSERDDVPAEVIAAGVRRYRELDQAGVGSAYLVEEVYRAMLEAEDQTVA